MSTPESKRGMVSLPLPLWLACVIFVICAGLPTQARARWQTFTAIQAAREALSLGLLKKWKQALERGDQALAKERPKMPLQVRTNAALWLHLLWAKLYQYMGILPPIRDVGSFEDRRALHQFIQKFARAISYLKQAHAHLEQYNRLYTQVMDRAKLQSQVYLQASLSLTRDLAERIRGGLIYMAFLRYAHNNWHEKQQIKRKLQQQQQILSRLKTLQTQTIRTQWNMQRRQKKLAASIQNAQKLYKKLEGQLQSQRVSAGLMIGFGVALVALGGTSIGLGITVKDNEKWMWQSCHIGGAKDKDNCASPSNITVRQQWRMGLYTGGATATGIGATLLILGIVRLPTKRQGAQAVLRSHNKYLDHERHKQRGGQSMRWQRRKHLRQRRQRGAAQMLAADLLPAANGVLLGQW